MQCGVTRELIYFTFTELRLRLPTDFDTAGIPQYSPEFLQSLFVSQKPVERLDFVNSASRTEEQSFQQAHKQVETPSDSTPLIPTTPVSDNPSLLDIEQQRRRELLARKAVIASRKGKQTLISTLRTPSPQPINEISVDAPSKGSEMSSTEAAPAATVDDFLNSIGPNQDTAEQDPPPPVKSEPDGMDVDEIPGLGGIWVSGESDTPTTEPPSIPVQADGPSLSTLLPDTSNSIVTSTGSLSSGEQTPLLQGDNIPPQRSGVKRPVAADFVDAERSQLHTYYSSFPNGKPIAHSSYAKRRSGGFAGITNTRRCVIELSDSEDEEYSEDIVASPQQRGFPPSRHGSFNAHFASNGSPTAVKTPPPTGINSLSSATLLKKELEIKRMREMIAQKEQMRLRKLVSVPIRYRFVVLMKA